MALRFFESEAEKQRKAAEAAALKQAKEEAEAPPADASPASIIEAARRMRRFKAEHGANSPEAKKLLSDNKEAFEKFLHSWPGDASELGKARAAFIERFEHVEYIKTLITPELVERLATPKSGVPLDHPSNSVAKNFQQMIRGIGAERFAGILQEQLLVLAARNPAEFDELAEIIETFEIVQTDPSFVERDQHAAEMIRRYKITDEKREELLGVLRGPGSPEEKHEAVLAQVRKSKGIMGWFHGEAEKSLVRLEAAKEELEADIASNADHIDRLDLEHAQIRANIERLEAAAEGAEDNDPIREELAGARAEETKNTHDRERNAATKTNLALLRETNNWQAITEKMAARKKLKREALQLQMALPHMETHVREVQGYMDDIAATLEAVLNGDAEVRKSLKKALLEEEEKPVPPKKAKPLPHSAGQLVDRWKEELDEAKKMQEGMIKEAIPSTLALQAEFDRIVLQDKAEGKNSKREHLKEEFLRRKVQAAKRAYAARMNRNKAIGDSKGSRQVAFVLIEKIIRKNRKIT